MATPPRPFQPNHHLHFSPLLRQQTARDSDGHVYKLYVQNEEQSCGLASASMLIDIYRRRHRLDASARESRLKTAAAVFPGSLVADDRNWAAGKPQQGSQLSNIEALLMSRGVKLTLTTWGNTTAGAQSMIQPALLTSPALVLIGWYPGGYGTARSGGHFVVAARRTKTGRVVILDPWYGRLTELAPGQVYQSNGYMDYIVYTRR